MPLSDPQAQVASGKSRYRVLAAGRRLGKTYLAIRTLAQYARTPGRRCFYVAPTYRQAKLIAWQDLKEKLYRFRWVSKVNETELTAYLKNGSEIGLKGAEKYDSLRGVGLDLLVLDEFADIKEEAWTEVLRPTLSDRQGHALFLGTPKGRNWAYDLWLRGQQGVADWQSWQFSTLQGGRVAPAEIEAARSDLDPMTFSQEYEASFLNFTGRAYYPFTVETHCGDYRGIYDAHRPLDISFDFNISPAVALVSQEATIPDTGLVGTVALGEVYIPKNGNTLAVCRKLIQEWGQHQGPVRIFGDATGGAGGSAKVLGSDWDLVRQELRPVFRTIEMRVPPGNPPEKARINAMNSRLQAGPDDAPIRRVAIDWGCKALIRDMEGVQVLDGGSGELDKRSNPDLTHISDALGYRIHRDYPIETRGATHTKVIGI